MIIFSEHQSYIRIDNGNACAEKRSLRGLIRFYLKAAVPQRIPFLGYPYLCTRDPAFNTTDLSLILNDLLVI